MGRYSTRCKPSCEETNRIDLAELSRRGALVLGNGSSLAWSRGGRQIGSVSYRVEASGLRLIYTATDRSGTRQNINELIPFTFTATRFGGRRRWFRCPACSKGCRVIYGQGVWFRCRRCSGLRYESQHEPYFQRARDRADRIRRKLAAAWGGIYDGDELPPKPPRMRWKTYRRLEQVHAAAEQQWLAGVINQFRLLY